MVESFTDINVKKQTINDIIEAMISIAISGEDICGICYEKLGI
jgi:hypothetical protein